MERGVEGTCTIDAIEEEKTENSGFLAVFEISFDKKGEGVGLGVAKGVFHAITVGVKHLFQSELVVGVFLEICRGGKLNSGPYLVVGVGLDSEGILTSKVNGG